MILFLLNVVVNWIPRMCRNISEDCWVIEREILFRTFLAICGSYVDDIFIQISFLTELMMTKGMRTSSKWRYFITIFLTSSWNATFLKNKFPRTFVTKRLMKFPRKIHDSITFFSRKTTNYTFSQNSPVNWKKFFSQSNLKIESQLMKNHECIKMYRS